MAKSSRASTRKANNRNLKSKVFGPIEAARNERLSAKLIELAAQPKPEHEEEMKIVEEDDTKADEEAAAANDDTMDLDNAKSAAASSKRTDKKRIEKRRKNSKIVFPKYGDKKTKKRR